MKLVVFSNLCPPLFVGGYEIGAFRVIAELRKRGHEVLVLSAHEYYREQADEYGRGSHAEAARAELVDVGLCLFGSLLGFYLQDRRRFWRQMMATLQARRHYRARLRSFRPDALLVFNPAGVLAPVLEDLTAYARQKHVPLLAYVSDPWLKNWPHDHPLWAILDHFRPSPQPLRRVAVRLAASILARGRLLPRRQPILDNILYCSDFLRRDTESFRPPSCPVGRVLPWGLADLKQTEPLGQTHFQQAEPLTLIYAGQLLEHKGLAVLLQALTCCCQRHRLVVIGDDGTAYAKACQRLIAERGLTAQVRFLGARPPETMRDLLRRSGHVLVVPSLWEEPFSLVVLEGMAVGLPVIAAQTGGTAEAVVDGDSGFLFPRGDFHALARRIDRLERDRVLCQRLGEQGRRRVGERFSLETMVHHLLSLVRMKQKTRNQAQRTRACASL